MAKKSMTIPKPPREEGVHGVALNVLGYREEDSWVALALEMDIRGRGATFEDALKELSDLIDMQIGFAYFKGQPDMIWRSADPVFFELFAEERRKYLRDLSRSGKLLEGEEYQVGGIRIPAPHIVDKLKRRFSEADA